MDALNKHYEAILEYWEGKCFCEIKLDWDYDNQNFDLSIPGYAEKFTTNNSTQIHANRNTDNTDTTHIIMENVPILIIKKKHSNFQQI